MKILITGINGFVGSRLTRELLARGYEVRGVDHPSADMRRIQSVLKDVDYVPFDLLQAGVEGWTQLLRGVDGCIHCAWFATPGKYLSALENVQWLETTLDLYRALRFSSCNRMVGIGTCFEYEPQGGALSENSPLSPCSLYAACKVSAYVVGRQLLAAQKVNFVWARLFYLFGEEEAQNRLVPDVIQKLLRGLPVSLTEGQQQRDFMYIGDAVRAVADIYESQVCGAVNVASGEPITVRRLVEIIASELGNYHLLKFGDRPENACDPVCIVADTSRLNNEVGFEREFSIDVAVRSVVDWWRRQDSVIQ